MKKKSIYLGAIIATVLIIITSCALYFVTREIVDVDGSNASIAGGELAAIPSPDITIPPATPVPTPEPTATPSPTPTPFPEYDINLMSLGDNLMHMGVVNTGRMSDGTYDYTFLFENIAPFLNEAEIKVTNQETILGGNDLGFSGYPGFNSPTQLGDAIAAAGFNVVLHASNHTTDKGLAGLEHCLNYWQEQHPEIVVCGMNGPESSSEIPLLEIEGITFALLNYTYGNNHSTLKQEYMGRLEMLCNYDKETGAIDFTTLNPEVIEEIQTAKTLADVVIVFPHWGTEYQTTASKYQQKFAAEIAAAGADVIIGTHPHVVQPIEWITSEDGRKTLCYYSLGNYVSTQKIPLTMLEGMAWITFHVDENGVSISEDKTGVVPMVCHYNSGPVRVESIYLLENYTEEMALRHGIWQYGEVPLHLTDLQSACETVFGDWVMHSSEILPEAMETLTNTSTAPSADDIVPSAEPSPTPSTAPAA